MLRESRLSKHLKIEKKNQIKLIIIMILVIIRIKIIYAYLSNKREHFLLLFSEPGTSCTPDLDATAPDNVRFSYCGQ